MLDIGTHILYTNNEKLDVIMRLADKLNEQ